ncbi:hypothetical protein NHH03_00180 [Stieleria sp. TO1_6]|uniref:hypothetical protein n=1 Tax=Stieleria tagensis TaxID=2956795 RepID=UPI00209AB323|nr:hypothetical protein [Stieleria tagensis]MCO8120136.1 hypothetical protein [Stieleria tagensis]
MKWSAIRGDRVIRTVPQLKEMRYAFALLTLAILASHACGQIILPMGNRPLYPIPVEIASNVPAKLQGDASLSFDSLDMYFDGGSHGAFFHRNDGRKLILFFPHPGYWTLEARKNRIQPVAVLIERNEKQILVEIMTDSKLNQRLVDLIDAGITTAGHTHEKLDILKRVRESVSKRSPLKEIADRLDARTGDLKNDEDPFGGVNPFD